MRFDWYSATVPVPPLEIVQTLLARIEKPFLNAERGKGQMNYAGSFAIHSGRGRSSHLATVLHGGSNGSPHVRVSGEMAPEIASIVRQAWPQHSVTRADVAIDFDGEGAWDKLFGVCGGVAKDQKVRWTTYGDFRENRDATGRTVYLGAPSSAVRVRCYEKGYELLAKGELSGPDELQPDLCRLEVQVRPPDRSAKLAASKYLPEQFWASSPWSRNLLRQAYALDVERVMMTHRREPDYVRSLRHMALQYRAPMEELISMEGGDDTALLKFIREIWSESDEHCQKDVVRKVTA